MITVTLRGRGGQGIKTGAHVIGTAAFLSGFYVQDQPLYGAERRGAPISAYVRISRQVILDRGQIDNPSLVVIGEESLMGMASDNPPHEISESTVILVNSPLSKSDLASRYNIKNSLIVFDLVKLSSGIIEKPHLGIAVAAAACKLLGLNFDFVKESIIKELVNIQVNRDEIARNVDLASKVFDTISPVTITTPREAYRESGILEPKYHEPAISTCAITATGNSMLRDRAQWSNYKPVIDYDKCTKCMVCYVYCPDSAYTIDSEGYPIVDYDACKGCNICKTECPVKIITLVERNKR
ncbi:MAG: 2-oxoacid:acceptor oxidoreductase family protein [Thaumarchaeota archaeon]|nr:2-oxoacid:acceptor oxidoreductase family protein [Nitrososphaerota archaeon]